MFKWNTTSKCLVSNILKFSQGIKEILNIFKEKSIIKGYVFDDEDFSDFDEQIYQSALKSGQECVSSIQDVNKYVEDIINSDGRLAFQAIFNAEKLTAKEFLFYWADVIVFQFQYSKRVEFCQSLAGKSTL